MCEKEEFLQTPFCSFGCDVGWSDRASLGGGSLIGRRQWWANLDQASKHLEVFRFRDLSPTPIPWVLEVLSTQAHLAVLSFGGAIDPGTLICWQWQHPTPNCYLYLAKCRCRLQHLFFGGIRCFSYEASCMTSCCGAIWSDAENSWSMNRNRKPENFLDPPNPLPPMMKK
jgi:hypothetical protein